MEGSFLTGLIRSLLGEWRPTELRAEGSAGAPRPRVCAEASARNSDLWVCFGQCARIRRQAKTEATKAVPGSLARGPKATKVTVRASSRARPGLRCHGFALTDNPGQPDAPVRERRGCRSQRCTSGSTRFNVGLATMAGMVPPRLIRPVMLVISVSRRSVVFASCHNSDG